MYDPINYSLSVDVIVKTQPIPLSDESTSKVKSLVGLWYRRAVFFAKNSVKESFKLI